MLGFASSLLHLVASGLWAADGHGFANPKQLFEQRLHAMQGNHVRTIAGCAVGVGVSLKKEAVYSNGNGSTSQSPRILTLASR